MTRIDLGVLIPFSTGRRIWAFDRVIGTTILRLTSLSLDNGRKNYLEFKICE